MSRHKGIGRQTPAPKALRRKDVPIVYPTLPKKEYGEDMIYREERSAFSGDKERPFAGTQVLEDNIRPGKAAYPSHEAIIYYLTLRSKIRFKTHRKIVTARKH
jgi:hypothetical protein